MKKSSIINGRFFITYQSLTIMEPEMPTLVATLSNTKFMTLKLRWNGQSYKLELKEIKRTMPPVNPNHSRTLIKQLKKIETTGHRSISFPITAILDENISLTEKTVDVSFFLKDLIFPFNKIELKMGLDPQKQDFKGSSGLQIICHLTKLV